MVIPIVSEQPRHLEPISADLFLDSRSQPAAVPTLIELDDRHADGIDVRLLWDPSGNRILVSVFDSKSGEAFEVEADPALSLDVFHHPFAYAAGHGASRREALPA